MVIPTTRILHKEDHWLAPLSILKVSRIRTCTQGSRFSLFSFDFIVYFPRLTIISSLITLVWFIAGNVLVYTSINTCRYASPRLWWLNFTILCILYLMVLEVVVLGFVVLIVAPILFVSAGHL